MSPLAKEIIEKLNKEDDVRVLAEVLDFYEYLKQKKEKQLAIVWNNLDEDEPTEKELKVIQEYKSAQEELILMDSLIKELNLNEQ